MHFLYECILFYYPNFSSSPSIVFKCSNYRAHRANTRRPYLLPTYLLVTRSNKPVPETSCRHTHFISLFSEPLTAIMCSLACCACSNRCIGRIHFTAFFFLIIFYKRNRQAYKKGKTKSTKCIHYSTAYAGQSS